MTDPKDFIKIITTRRSIRKWQDKPVPQEFIKDLVACGKSAPSPFNTNPVELIVVNLKEIISLLLADRLRMKDYPGFINSDSFAKIRGADKYNELEHPPVVVAVCGDTTKCQDLASLIPAMSCSAQNVLLGAHSLGLGAVWMYVYEDESDKTELKVKEFLGIPQHIRVLCMIGIGFPDEEPNNLKKETTFYHENYW